MKRKAWTLKDTPKTLATKSQYVPSKLPEDVMEKIGEKLRAACFVFRRQTRLHLDIAMVRSRKYQWGGSPSSSDDNFRN